LSHKRRRRRRRRKRRKRRRWSCSRGWQGGVLE